MTPTYTLPTNTIILPDYAITATAAPDGDRLTVHYTVDFQGFDAVTNGVRNPKDLENIMIWVDGEFACQLFDNMNPNTWLVPKGHTWVQNNSGRHREGTVSINLRALNTLEGPGRVTLSFWDSGFIESPFSTSPGGICYIDLDCNVPRLPVKAVRPGTILRCLFQSSPGNLTAADRLAVKAAGFNAFEQQLFHNPRNASTTLAQAQAQWQQLVGDRIQTAKDLGMLIVGCGDDFARDQSAYNWTRDTLWAEEYIAWVSQRCKDYGNVACCEVQDEVWVGAINDPVFQKVRRAWTSVPGYVPMGWPALAMAGNAPLEVPGWADYVTRYCDPGVTVWRTGHAYLHTYRSMADFLRVKTVDIAYHKFAVGINGSCTGPYYDKMVPGGNYQPGDHLKALGNTPRMIVTQAALTLCHRSTMFRVYAWDGPWANQRANGTLGSEQQTGSQPGDVRWAGVTAACRMIAEYESALLGPSYPPAHVGPFVFGYRDGLTIAVNVSETEENLAAVAGVAKLWTEAGGVPFAPGDLVPPGGVVVCVNS